MHAEVLQWMTHVPRLGVDSLSRFPFSVRTVTCTYGPTHRQTDTDTRATDHRIHPHIGYCQCRQGKPPKKRYQTAEQQKMLTALSPSSDAVNSHCEH